VEDSNHFRATSLFMVAMLMAQRVAAVAAQSPYTVGANVQVTHAESGRSVQETVVCTDPRNARHLVAGAIVEHGDTTANVFLVSFDGGMSWRQTAWLPATVDPSCAIGADGIALVSSVHDSAPSGTSYLQVRRSRDGGRTWTESLVHDNMASLDRPWVTAGAAGQVWIHSYVQAPRTEAGARGAAAAAVYASRDSGQVFDRVAVVPGTSYTAPWFFPANGVATSDGTFIALLVELDNTQRNMFRGRSDTASAPHTANAELRVIRLRRGTTTVDTSSIGIAFYDWRVAQLSMATLAVDRTGGPFRGRLYAAWPDARYGRRTQILLSRSDDQGRTWAPPSVVSDGPDTLSFGPNHFMPVLAVNRAGVVGVSWYDRRASADSISYTVRFRASLDGGDSWLPSVQVSSAPNRLQPKDRHLNGGDTSGLAAAGDGRFHLVWIDNRTGVAQAWAGTVSVRGKARARRHPQLTPPAGGGVRRPAAPPGPRTRVPP